MAFFTDETKRSIQRLMSLTNAALAGRKGAALTVMSAVGLCATLLVCSAACDSGAAPSGSATTSSGKSGKGTSNAKSPEALRAAGSGTITGTVRYTGAPIEPAEVKVTKDNEICGTMKHSEAVIVAENKGLRFAVVSITGIEKEAEPQQLKLNQKNCMYEPHVQATVIGSKLEIQNSDPVLHNVHAYIGEDETAFNLAMPKKDQKIKKKLTDSGLMRISCDAGHTWMGAFIMVFEHPYFAVSDAKGEFVLNDVPVGKHELELWHEKFGKLTKTVTVAKGETAKVSFEVK